MCTCAVLIFYIPVIVREDVGMQQQAVGRPAASISFSHVLFALSPNRGVTPHLLTEN